MGGQGHGVVWLGQWTLRSLPINIDLENQPQPPAHRTLTHQHPGMACAQVHNALGYAYFNMEKPAEAVEEYQRAVELQVGVGG